MDTRRIGGTKGFDISVVGLGCNAFGRRKSEAESIPVIQAAFEAGITFFDTAEGYGNGHSEEYIGRALKGHRDEVQIATKFGMVASHVPGKRNGSRENAKAAIDMSLQRLQMDYVDLYQLHRPDSSTPIAETLDGMNDLVKAGKVRLIGCSNLSSDQLREAVQVARDMALDCFVTAQDPWSVLDRGIEDDLVPVCAEHGIGILPYYPLAKGLLTGKYRRESGAPDGSRLAGSGDLSRADFETIEQLEQFATSRGFSLLTLAVSWLASQPVTASVISGATRVEQLSQNAAAADWKMTAEDLAEIDRIVE